MVVLEKRFHGTFQTVDGLLNVFVRRCFVGTEVGQPAEIASSPDQFDAEYRFRDISHFLFEGGDLPVEIFKAADDSGILGLAGIAGINPPGELLFVPLLAVDDTCAGNALVLAYPFLPAVGDAGGLCRVLDPCQVVAVHVALDDVEPLSAQVYADGVYDLRNMFYTACGDILLC